ncbi:MAG: amino acid adenylation domain-containing protein [Anaerolineae bacterium]
MTDLSERIAKLSPAKRALLRQRLKQQEEQPEQIRPQPRKGNSLPLSFAQRRLWFLDQMEPGSPAYNIPAAVRLTGPLDRSLLEQSLTELVRRHEALRTTFQAVEGRPRQVIAPPGPLDLRTVDLRGSPGAGREAHLRRLVAEEAGQPFDLARGPLLRATLFQLDEEEHALLLTMHHIVSDGWSMGILFQELSALYRAFAAGDPSPLPEPPLQYADFALWQRDWLQGQVLDRQLGYWREQLAGAPAGLALPTDRPRPAVQTYRGGQVSLVLPKALADGLKALSQDGGGTLFMTLLAAFQTLLYRYSGQTDQVVGTPVANRNRVEIEGLVGFFVNTLVLRADLGGNPTFRELLGRVREVALGAQEHQDLPFEKLVEELQPERDLSQTPLFQVWFVLQNAPAEALDLPGLRASPFEVETGAAKFDLSLTLTETETGLRGSLGYNRDLFEASTAERMAAHFQTLLAGVAADPEQRLADLPLADETEPARLIQPGLAFVEFEQAALEGSLAARFEAQVEKYPGRLAVKTRRYAWTYRTLNQAANRVAAAILAGREPGVGRVALLFDHDAPMIAAILGALKAGQTYVPLDPTYPQERLAYMLADSGADAILTGDRNRPLAGRQGRIINLDRLDRTAPAENPNLALPPETLAYILYTSGSTGQPKGVMQSQANVLHHIRTYTQALCLSPEDGLTLLSSYSFDAAVMDIFGALLNGAALYPVDVKREGLAGLARWLREQPITVYHSTPTVYRYFLGDLPPDQTFPGVRCVVLGGEEVFRSDMELYKRHFPPECVFVNGLGPTESTLALQYFLNHETQLSGQRVPVGYPVAGTQVLLLDEEGRAGSITGEIALRGPHLALGYWGRPGLTAAAFLPDPDGGARRVYRTGDLGRRRPDGSLEFIGRKDSQVKVRGFRVELREIEAVLSAHPAVREAVVLARQTAHKPGEKELVAYVVPGPGQAAAGADLRRYLKARLPDYMLPAAFVTLDRLPLTPTGKLDRRALPAPRPDPDRPADGYVAPRDLVELQLARLWEEVLDVRPVGVRDNFFELGGHSLLGARLFARIEEAFERRLPLATLFQAPTVEQQAAVLRRQGDPTGLPGRWSSLVAVQPGGSRPPLFCVPGNLGNVFVDLGDLARYLGPDQPFYGLQDGLQNPAQIGALAARYLQEIRTVQPEGPYLLGGVCWGGVVAYEMAQQLRREGQPVALLAMVEPTPPPAPGLRTYASLAADLLGRVARRVGYHSRRFSQTNAVERGAYARLKTKLVANMWAAAGYAPQPYRGQITLFLTRESLAGGVGDSRLGWQDLAAGGAEVRPIPGDHESITRTGDAAPDEAQIQALAEALRASINQALVNGTGETERTLREQDED